MSSIEPNDGSGEVDGGEEVAGGFVVAGGDGAVLLELGEDVLDQVPRLVELLVIEARLLAASSGRNDDFLSGFPQRLENAFLGIVALVGQDGCGVERRQQHIRPVQIAGLAGGQTKTGRIAQAVDRGIDLGAQSAFAAPDGLVGAVFFWAPALC